MGCVVPKLPTPGDLPNLAKVPALPNPIKQIPNPLPALPNPINHVPNPLNAIPNPINQLPNPFGNGIPEYRFNPPVLPVGQVDSLKIEGSNSSSGLPRVPPGDIKSLVDELKADELKGKSEADPQRPTKESHLSKKGNEGPQGPPPPKEQESPPAPYQHQNPTSDLPQQPPHLSQLVHPNPITDPSVMLDSVKDMDSAIQQLGKTKMNSAIGFKARSSVQEDISRTNKGLSVVREESEIVNEQNPHHFAVPINLKLDIRVQ